MMEKHVALGVIFGILIGAIISFGLSFFSLQWIIHEEIYVERIIFWSAMGGIVGALNSEGLTALTGREEGA